MGDGRKHATGRKGVRFPMGPANVQLARASTAYPIPMNAVSTPSLLRSRPALIALVAAVPLAAQSAPGGVLVPEPTLTPSPAPADPADERAPVTIPPRETTPTPRIAPETVLTGGPVSASPPKPDAARPTPLRLSSLAPRPTAQATPTVAAMAVPTAKPSPTVATAATVAPPIATPATKPGFGGVEAPTFSVGTPEGVPQTAALPSWWPLATAALGGWC